MATMAAINAGETYVIFGSSSGAPTEFPLIFDLATDLNALSGSIIFGAAPGDELGFSVSTAGDVNGDGIDDIILGARFNDNGGTQAGEAYVIFGRAGGFESLDLALLTPADGFAIQGDSTDDNAGWSVSTAGDIDGDGFDEIIVGARGGDGGGAIGGADAGEVYVIYGKSAGFADIDLTTLAPADGFVIVGDAAGDEVGRSVAAAGDVNGDGLGDFIIGAPYGDNGGLAAGEAYVIFGKAGVFGALIGGRQVADLTLMGPADGFVIQGDVTLDNAGWSVAGAGDINNDGFDDIIVGAPKGNDGGGDAGEAYVIFGKSAGFANIDLTTLAPADGFIIQGDAAGDQAGWSVDSAGDINGDGHDDLIIGARFSADGGITAGEAYVIFGKSAGFTNIDLSALAPADGFSLQGDGPGDQAGYSVSSAGDVNGDGFDDLIIGAPNYNASEAYVIYGKAGAFGDLDLGALTAADGFVIQGIESSRAGQSVSAAGDVDGDGFDDLLIGASKGDLAGTDAGEAYIIYGRGTGSPVFPTLFDPGDDINPASGATILGADAGDRLGWSVASAGDINGDGYDDVILGAPQGDNGGTSAGEAYVLFGSADGIADLDLTALALADGFVILGDVAGDQAGFSVSSAGDVNGDDFDDLIVGTPYGDNGGTDAGEAYVIFGKASGFANIDLTVLAPADGFIIQGDAAYDFAGRAVSSAGDINGDGFDDLIVGAPLGDNGGTNAGEAYVIFGKAAAFTNIDLTTLAPADGFIIQGDIDQDNAGWSVSTAGDINGDGFADLIVGARFGDNGGTDAGEAYVIFGKAAAFANIDLTTLAPADGFIIQGDAAGDNAGWSVSSAGDVNGDGYDDLIVGAPYGDNGGDKRRRGLCHLRQIGGLRQYRPHRPRAVRRLHHLGRRLGRPRRFQRLGRGRRQWRRLRRPHRRRA